MLVTHCRGPQLEFGGRFEAMDEVVSQIFLLETLSVDTVRQPPDVGPKRLNRLGGQL